jgi:hypothetical protein
MTGNGNVGIGATTFTTRESNTGSDFTIGTLLEQAGTPTFGLGVFTTAHQRLVFGGNNGTRRINTSEIYCVPVSLVAGAETGQMLLRTKATGGVMTTAITIDATQNVGIGCEPTSTLHDNGSFATKIVETSGSNNYTVLPTDYTIRCHYFSGTKYITMPSAGNFIGRILCFVGACTVTATTSVIKQADESISDAILNAGTNLFFCMMQSDGTYWQVVSRGTGL